MSSGKAVEGGVLPAFSKGVDENGRREIMRAGRDRMMGQTFGRLGETGLWLLAAETS